MSFINNDLLGSLANPGGHSTAMSLMCRMSVPPGVSSTANRIYLLFPVIIVLLRIQAHKFVSSLGDSFPSV